MATKTAPARSRATHDYDLPHHPDAAIMPMLEKDALNALAADIKANGLMESIKVYNGQIVDGRNRMRACELAGVAPTIEQWEPAPGETVAGYVASMNIVRRHLTASQRAALAVRLEERWKAEKKAAARTVPTAAFSNPDTTVPRQPKGRTRERIAKQSKVSTGYMAEAQRIKKADIYLFELMEKGEITLAEANARHVLEALETNRIDQSPLPRRKVQAVIKKLEEDGRMTAKARKALDLPTQAKQNGAEAKPKKYLLTKEQLSPQAKSGRLRKFSKVKSSRTEVTIEVAFGNGDVARDYLARMQDDPKVLQVSFIIHE